MGAGAGAVGVEGAVAGTAGDALLGGPLHSLIIVGVGGNVRKVQRLDLSKFRRNRHLGGGHGKGKLAVALVLHLDLAAAGVLHGQGVQLIAAVGLDGNGHGIALGGGLGADGHIAVLDRGRGDVIASGGRAGTAAGRRAVIAPLSGKGGVLGNGGLIACFVSCGTVRPTLESVVVLFGSRRQSKPGAIRNSLYADSLAVAYQSHHTRALRRSINYDRGVHGAVIRVGCVLRQINGVVGLPIFVHTTLNGHSCAGIDNESATIFIGLNRRSCIAPLTLERKFSASTTD